MPASLSLVLFDRNPAVPAGLGFTFFCLAIVAFVLMLVIVRRRPPERQPPALRWLAGMLTKPGRIVGVVLVLGSLGAIQPVWRFIELRAAVQAGDIGKVEGVVMATRAWYQSSTRSTGQHMESFTVGSSPPRTFQYSQNEVGNPFPLLSENGGVLKPGKPVRVTLAGNAIIKVETDNDCQIYPRCSRFGWGSFIMETERK